MAIYENYYMPPYTIAVYYNNAQETQSEIAVKLLMSLNNDNSRS